MEKLTQPLRDIVASHTKTALWLGVIVFAVGAAGGVVYNGWLPITRDWAQWSMMAAGAVLVAASFLKRTQVVELDAGKITKLGIEITAPQANERVTSKTRVTVVSKEPLPDGYELRVLRGYPRVKGIVPNAMTHKTAGKLEWVAHDFDIGGAPKDTRTVEVWLVGANGTALFENWEANHSIVSKANRELKRLGEIAKQTPNIEWLPPITGFTTDMHRCQSVVVFKAE